MPIERPEADPAHARIGEILRKAIEPPNEEQLEDETRRLMLHLSLEPVRVRPPALPVVQAQPRWPVLIRRFLGLLRRLMTRRPARRN